MLNIARFKEAFVGPYAVFFRFVRFEVEDRSRIWFWHDVWVGDKTLKEALTVLFNIAHFKEAFVGPYAVFEWHMLVECCLHQFHA